jgi:DNA-directed RNA polymerase subunit RPC12/RpoP
MIAFECSGCGKTIKFQDDTPGIRVKCIRCGAKTYTPFTFTESSSPPPPSGAVHVPGKEDSVVYCPHCNAIVGLNDVRCKACGSLNARGAHAGRLGVLVCAGLAGCFATGVFVKILFMSWPTWEKGIKKYGPGDDVPPSDAGIIAGAIIFLAATIGMAWMIHRNHNSKG